MLLIGLGAVGKNILSGLTEGNNIILIDEEDHEDFDTLIITPSGDGKFKHERYDAINTAELDLEQYRDTEKCFIVSGGSDVSGASMRLLNALGGATTTVVYIKPEKDSMTNIQVMQERVTYGILQESARSGMVKQIVLFDNAHIASFMGNISIKEYFKTINQHIIYALNTMIFCEENEQVFGKKRDNEELNRIIALGRVEENVEVLFFPLTNVKKETQYPLSKTYCYLYPEAQLEDVNLLSAVKKELAVINGDLEDVNFGIYEIGLDRPYKMVIIETSLVQS
jgi:hypothetical protein